ncbi:TPA: hypothetical protein ACH3X2_009808 [Trebouxia sp. C0005]
MDSVYAAPAARGIDRRCHCLGSTTQLSNYGVSQRGNTMATHATANSYAAQQHFADGRAFQLRDARGAHFEPQTSYIDHYPEKELPVHTPQPAAPVTGVPFTASTEYDNQYLPKSLTFNQIGTYGNPAWMGNSHGHMQKLPTVSSETTNQHFYPYWGVTPPQKKGYAVRRISAAPALDFAGDTFTTTNAVEYQPKPSSYTRPTGVTVAQPLSEACDKHTTYNSFFQAKPTEGFIRVPRGSSPAPPLFTATTTYE